MEQPTDGPVTAEPTAGPRMPQAAPVSEKVTGRRAVAALIDLVPLSLLFVGMATRAGTVDWTDGFSVRLENWWFLAFLVAAIAYFAVSEGLRGTSPGKAMLGLEVRRLDGDPLTWGAALGRNALRPLDGLPVLYLVGIVVIRFTPENQRVGDLAAGTVVQRRASGGFSSASATVMLGVLVAISGAVLIGLGPPPLTVGGLSVSDDVDPFVQEAVDEAFRTLSVEALSQWTIPELASLPQFSEALNQAADNPGPLVGEFSIVDSEVRDWPIPELGTFPGIEYRIRGEFRDGTTELLLAVINRNGTLQIAAWQVLFV